MNASHAAGLQQVVRNGTPMEGFASSEGICVMLQFCIAVCP